MDIDSTIKKCLERGQIHISTYQDGYLCATLDLYEKELFRVFSDKGSDHLILLLASKVFDDKSFEKIANNMYIHPLAPLSEERSKLLYRLASKGSVSIFLTGETVHVEQYVSTMQSLSARPRPSSRNGFGQNLSEAIEALEKKDFNVVTCVPDKLE